MGNLRDFHFGCCCLVLGEAVAIAVPSLVLTGESGVEEGTGYLFGDGDVEEVHYGEGGGAD